MDGEFQARVEGMMRRVQAACRRANRDPRDVVVIAVSKTFGPDDVGQAAECGLRVFGESRVQEAAQKIPLCPGNLEWHMVGHLQRNKVRHALGLFRMVHSVDSLRLLEALDAASAEAGVALPVLLEVNVSGESSKFGLRPDDVPALLEQSGRLRQVEIRGLMTIPPFQPEPEGARPFFRKLRELRDRWRDQCGMDLAELSMGMSDDFEVAVEEGATMVRVGTALFGKRKARVSSVEGRGASDE